MISNFNKSRFAKVCFGAVGLFVALSMAGCSGKADSGDGEKTYVPPSPAQAAAVQQEIAAHTQQMMNNPNLPPQAKAMMGGAGTNLSLPPVGQRQVATKPAGQ